MMMRIRPMTATEDELVGCTILCDVCDRLAPACFFCEPPEDERTPGPRWLYEWICCSLTCANEAAVRTACGLTAPDMHPQERLRAAGLEPDETWGDKR